MLERVHDVTDNRHCASPSGIGSYYDVLGCASCGCGRMPARVSSGGGGPTVKANASAFIGDAVHAYGDFHGVAVRDVESEVPAAFDPVVVMLG
jgi:hypothetical protein